MNLHSTEQSMILVQARRFWPVRPHAKNTPSRQSRRPMIAAVDAAAAALQLARESPDAIVHLFVSDWAEVDALRQQVLAEAMEDRVRVRNIDAMPLLDTGMYDCVINARENSLAIGHEAAAHS